MFAALLLVLTPCQQLDELADTLSAANDKSSYENGAYEAAKQLADLRSEEAMELRLALFEKKMDTYRGVYLREWFYSGYLKASTKEEADLMAAAAASRKRDDWHRILLLRSLARCSAPVDASLLLDKSFDKSSAEVQREWSASLGTLLAEGRLDFGEVALRKEPNHEILIRHRLLETGFADGYLPLESLTAAEVTHLTQIIHKAKDPGDRAIAVRVLGAHPEAWPALAMASAQVFAEPECGPRTAFLEACVEHRIHAMVPVLLLALSDEAKRTPNRFTGDIGATLRALTGQGFGDSPELWNDWFSEAGEAWLLDSIQNPELNSAPLERRDRDTVARFFGLAVETSNVVVLVDGSGSMSTNSLGGETCASAAAIEAGKFLEQLPKEAMFQVLVIEEEPILGFKKLMSASKANRGKAVKFLESRPYRSTSALYDALEKATSDPLVDTLILVSDGGSSAGKHQYSGHLLDSAKRLHRRTGVRIHTVLVTDSTKHEPFMRELAETTGGRMVRP